MNRRDWIARSSTAAAGVLLTGATVPRPGSTFLRNAGTPADPIRLHSNENPLGPSEPAREAMRRAFDAGWMYPSESYAALIEQIAFTDGVSPDQVFLGAGSHEVLRTTGTAFGLSGGHIVAPYPTYGAFGYYAAAAGAMVEKVPLSGDKEMDLSALEAAVTEETRLMFICNPNNPTGRVVPSGDLRSMIARLNGRTSILVDEAYHEYVEDARYASCVDLVRDGADIIVSRTFSKIFGLAGLRVGYAIAQPDTVRRLLAFRNRHSVSSVSVAAARASLGDDAFVEASREENAAGREIVYKAARSAGMAFLGSHGNYVFIHVGEPIRRFQQRMAGRGIRVGRAFDPYTDWARISIGTRAEMEVFSTALAEVASEVGDR